MNTGLDQYMDIFKDAVEDCKRLRIYTLPFIVKVLTFAP